MTWVKIKKGKLGQLLTVGAIQPRHLFDPEQPQRARQDFGTCKGTATAVVGLRVISMSQKWIQTEFRTTRLHLERWYV